MIENNTTIINIIEKCLNETLNGVSVKKKFKRGKSSQTEGYESGYMFKQSTYKDLDHDMSDSFLTQATLSELERILGSPETFKKLTTSEKKKMQIDLSKLNKDEYVWKTSTKKTVHDPNACHLLYPEGYEYFSSTARSYIKPGVDLLKEGQRSEKRYFPSKAKMYLKGMSKSLVENGFKAFSVVVDLKDSEYDTIFEDLVSIRWIFNDFIRVILKKSHDNIFNHSIRESRKFNTFVDDDILVAHRHAVFKDASIVLAMYLINIALIYVSERDKIEIEYGILGKILKNHLRKNIKKFDFDFTPETKKELEFARQRVNWWGTHLDNTRSILLILEKSKIFSVKKEQKKQRSNIMTVYKYVLPNYMADSVLQHTKFPRIFKPDSIDNEIFEDKIKPIFMGECVISKSDKYKKTLNYSQKKKFRIITSKRE